MKEFHIISTGVSFLTNAQNKGVIEKRNIADEEFWKDVLDNYSHLESLYKFLKEDPKANSAELNTFLRVVEGKNSDNIEVYLFGTNTVSNDICRRLIEKFLKESGYRIYSPYEVSGYFWEAKYYDEKGAVDDFKRGISELLDRLIYLAKKKIEEGYKVYFNPTGGLKAHVIATALAGFLNGCDIYYMNEEFKSVVFLPKLLYIPKGKELEVLKILSDKKPRSGMEFEKIKSEYGVEMERLSLYGLVDIEEDELGKAFRIRITNKGFFILQEVKGG